MTEPTAKEVYDAARDNIPWVKAADERAATAEYLALAILNEAPLPCAMDTEGVADIDVAQAVVANFPDVGDERALKQLRRALKWAASEPTVEVAAYLVRMVNLLPSKTLQDALMETEEHALATERIGKVLER